MLQKDPVSLAMTLILASVAWLAAPGEEAASPSEAMTGLEGVICEGPIFGGPSNRGLPETRPLANTRLIVQQRDRVVSSVKTDSDGTFRILLPPGHYTISRQGGDGGCSFEAEVIAGQMRKVQWTCDTGRR